MTVTIGDSYYFWVYWPFLGSVSGTLCPATGARKRTMLWSPDGAKVSDLELAARFVQALYVAHRRPPRPVPVDRRLSAAG